jgi:hypothetical protein
MVITSHPDNWVILKIQYESETYYKVFGVWTGGYLRGDSWQLNSGIEKVTQDDEYYYFIGFSGSCYKCNKHTYGIKALYGVGVLNNIIEKSEGKAVKLDDNKDWENFFKLLSDTTQ